MTAHDTRNLVSRCRRPAARRRGAGPMNFAIFPPEASQQAHSGRPHLPVAVRRVGASSSSACSSRARSLPSATAGARPARRGDTARMDQSRGRDHLDGRHALRFRVHILVCRCHVPRRIQGAAERGGDPRRRKAVDVEDRASGRRARNQRAACADERAHPAGNDLAGRHPLVLPAGSADQAGRRAGALYHDKLQGRQGRHLRSFLRRILRPRPLDDGRAPDRPDAGELPEMVAGPAPHHGRRRRGQKALHAHGLLRLPRAEGSFDRAQSCRSLRRRRGAFRTARWCGRTRPISGIPSCSRRRTSLPATRRSCRASRAPSRKPSCS